MYGILEVRDEKLEVRETPFQPLTSNFQLLERVSFCGISIDV